MNKKFVKIDFDSSTKTYKKVYNVIDLKNNKKMQSVDICQQVFFILHYLLMAIIMNMLYNNKYNKPDQLAIIKLKGELQ